MMSEYIQTLAIATMVPHQIAELIIIEIIIVSKNNLSSWSRWLMTNYWIFWVVCRRGWQFMLRFFITTESFIGGRRDDLLGGFLCGRRWRRNMWGFQSVDANVVFLTIIEFEGDVFFISLQDFERASIGCFQGSSYPICSEPYVRTSLKVFRNENFWSWVDVSAAVGLEINGIHLFSQFSYFFRSKGRHIFRRYQRFR